MSTRSERVGRSMQSPMTQKTFTWCRTVRGWGASPMCTRTRKLGTAGRRFALEGIADNLNSTFEAVKGAVFLNEEIVVLLQRTVGAARLSMARFRPDGSYVSNSFSVLGLPSAMLIHGG